MPELLQKKIYPDSLAWDDPEGLARWLAASRVLLTASEDPALAFLLGAIREGKRLQVIYYSGSLAAQERTITPIELFEVDGFKGIYLTAYCHLRLAARTFRTELLEISFRL